MSGLGPHAAGAEQELGVVAEVGLAAKHARGLGRTALRAHAVLPLVELGQAWLDKDRERHQKGKLSSR